VPTDPYVPVPLDEKPRQQQNFAPGVHMPPARSWEPDRPGDEVPEPDAIRGGLVGSPGPSVGFALTLAARARDRLKLEPHEHAEDAVAAVAEIAMKRASSFGRAPTVVDVDVAIDLLGYQTPATGSVASWRPAAVRHAAHDYVCRRALADAVSTAVLRLPPAEVGAHLDEVRRAIAAGDIADAASAG
jgi:hypothetical protein